jgi:hypothetical protein
MSAKGRSIDIDKVKLANEETVAVGNMRVNARGDQLGAGNKVVASRNQVMDQIYAVEDAPYSPNDPTNFVPLPVAPVADDGAIVHPTTPVNMEQLTELMNSGADSVRGSLASSVASKGPSRI